MKRLLCVLCLTCGCQGVQIVSDHDSYVTSCYGYWVKCIHEACPNGFDIILNDDEARE